MRQPIQILIVTYTIEKKYLSVMPETVIDTKILRILRITSSNSSAKLILPIIKHQPRKVAPT